MFDKAVQTDNAEQMKHDKKESEFAQAKNAYLDSLLHVRNLSQQTVKSYRSDLEIFESW